MFQLIDVSTSQPVTSKLYSSAQEALAARDSFPGVKLRIQQITDDSWKHRETTRFLDGEYERLPDYIQIYTLPDHYAHVAQKDPTKIAFTESPEKGMKDIQTVVSMSTYLGRFANIYGPRLQPHEIRDLAARYETRSMVNEDTLVISHERSAFRFAYDNQPVKSESSNYISCMARSAASYTRGANLHPAEAYATDQDGLAIAYTTDPHHPKAVTSRAVVWPKKMLFVRVYGLDDNYRIALVRMLEERGYSRHDTFKGAPLARIPVDGYADPTDEDGTFLMPYIDGDDKCVSDQPDGGRFFITTSTYGDYSADSTGGTIEVGRSSSRYTCDNCGDGIHEDDEQFTVDGDAVWCMSCYDNEAFTCERSGESFSNSYGDPTTVNRRERRLYGPHAGEWRTLTEMWSRDVAERYAFHCDHTDEWYCQRSYSSIDVTTNTRRGGETWCQEACEDDYFTCPDCGDHFAIDMAHPDSLHTGQLRCVDCHNEHIADMEARGEPQPTFVADPNQIALPLSI